MQNIDTKNNDLFTGLLFLYFFTLHADRLSFSIFGCTIRLNNLLALFLLSCVCVRFRQKSIHIPKALSYPLLAITFSLTLSCLFSPYKQRCLYYMGWYVFTVLCYVLLPYCLSVFWDQKRVFSLYCLSFLAVGGVAVLQLILSICHLHDPFIDQYITENIVRPNAFCFEPSFYALYMTPFVFMYNYHFLTARNQPFWIFKKKSLPQALMINLLYLISTSTSVVFAYVLFALILFIHNTRQWKNALKFLFSALFLTLAIALFAPFLLRNFLLKFFFYGFMTHHSFYERFIGFLNGWTIFLQHPILGVGLGGYPCHLMSAYLEGSSSYVFLSMHELMPEVKNPVKLFDAMSCSTELLASLGSVGFVAFCALIVACFLQVKHVLHNRQLALSLLISLAITLCILQFNQGLFRTYIWTHLALTFSFLQTHKSVSAKKDDICRPNAKDLGGCLFQ